MLRLLGKIPNKVTLALSGGVDSMVTLDFLSKKHKLDAAFFDHGTEHSNQAKEFVKEECSLRKIVLHVGRIAQVNRDRKQSQEEHWRNERYNFLHQFENVITSHHLDDVVETWVWSSLHGTSSLMPYRRGNVIRPFLLNRKSEFEDRAIRKNIKWIKDNSNDDTRYTRNYIRHQLMPHVLHVNPGIHTLLCKKLVDRQKLDKLS